MVMEKSSVIAGRPFHLLNAVAVFSHFLVWFCQTKSAKPAWLKYFSFLLVQVSYAHWGSSVHKENHAKKKLSGEGWELKRTSGDFIILPCRSHNLSDPISCEDGTVVFKLGGIRDSRFKMPSFIIHPLFPIKVESGCPSFRNGGQQVCISKNQSSAKLGKNLVRGASCYLILLQWVPSAVVS